MSRFFSSKYSKLIPYTPGEQPKDMEYVKLNTNESPYAPSENVYEAVKKEAEKLHLYSDPEAKIITEKIAKRYGVDKDMVLVTNGSDEVLNFAFMAYGNTEKEMLFPEISYGFYPVFADLNGVKYRQVPLKDDFTIDPNDYIGKNTTVVIANPNAPTGLALSLAQIEEIVKSSPNNVVVIDEAYVDFGAESCVELVHKYENLLVTMTFSKSRSMAGARIGFGIGSKAIINDLNTIKYSTNPYNVNRISQVAGACAIDSDSYYMDNCKKIIENREYTKKELEKMGFFVLDSRANFLFAKSDKISGEELYLKLKENGILVRHFKAEKIKDFNRITIGTKAQMDIFLGKTKEILEAKK
ncbi:MAG: histidinol-phosphate transaminase [Ruminococcaceae bacterium]|nr:histidinol-phosphate transaminase [Oscillospiraceae bacterium]